MTRVTVLGGGLVGGLIARDLATDPTFRVVVVDRSAAALERLRPEANLVGRVADLSRSEDVERAVADADVVAVAVPGWMGHAVLRTVIESAKPAVDISFGPEDPFDLDDLARRQGVPVVVDCGVAPGLSNLLVGRAAAGFDRVDDVEILVGGLPEQRFLPWEYRAVFSPVDVIEEYLRPCRIRRGGELVTLPALSEPESVDVPGLGTVEAFLTDGLRTLLRTVPARNLVEKTLRYPGHADRIRFLRDAGFLAHDTVEVDGQRVSPRAVTQKLLFQAWELPAGAGDLTVLRVTVVGAVAGAARTVRWDLLDRNDRQTGATSMARTTGFPCALVVRLVADGTWSRPGITAPEALGADAAIAETILDGLAGRGVRLTRRETLAA